MARPVSGTVAMAARTVTQLRPGDEVHNGGDSAVFLGTVRPHPLFPPLWMVIWRLPGGMISLDALDPNQHVGYAMITTVEERRARLRQALLGAQPT